MIEKAKSVRYSAWWGVHTGAPQMTMYASPIVSTYTHKVADTHCNHITLQ